MTKLYGTAYSQPTTGLKKSREVLIGDITPFNLAQATGLTKQESDGLVRQTVITVSSLAIAMTDATTAGSHGHQKLGDFPAGNIVVLGAVTDLSVTGDGSAVASDASVVGSIGTVQTQTDNATLTTTEADIVASTAATLTSDVGAMAGKTTALAVLDGTSSAKSAYLNFAIPDADSSGDGTLTVSGTITLIWVNSGDV